MQLADDVQKPCRDQQPICTRQIVARLLEVSVQRQPSLAEGANLEMVGQNFVRRLPDLSQQRVALNEVATFHTKLELMARVELAPALLFGARRLMLQMTGWLAARHCGVTAYTLRWCHDAMRSKAAGYGGEMTVRTAQPTRDIEHLTRLLAEHLAKVQLLAPVGDLELLAVDVQSLDEKTLSLLPEPTQVGEGLAMVLERIAARLGPERVLRPMILEDHRIEWMCHWQPAPTKRARKLNRAPDMPQPTFILPEPLRLAMRVHRPLYQGVLQLLAGPHRVEGGWWDRTTKDGEAVTRHIARDYWVALSEHAGVLWVFQTRLAEDETAWFLHGMFA